MTLRDFFDRYGLALGLVGVLSLVLALLPGNASNRTVSEIGAGGTAGAAAGEFGTTGGTVGGTIGGVGGPGGGGSSGGASGGALLPGGDVGSATVEFGKGDCRADGREVGITMYQPPCVLWTGSNGGATARGVAGDKIKIVRWMGQVAPETQAILEANKLADPPERRTRSYQALLKYANQHTITYGREVVMETLAAGGPSEDDRAMRSDAIRIARDMQAFAVIEGTPDAGIPKVLAQALAAEGVICMCTSSFSSQFYKDNPPYIFGTGLPTSTDYAMHIGEFIGKRMWGKSAKWAGDELNPRQGYRLKERVLGLLWIGGANDRHEEEGRIARDQLIAELAKHGATVKVDHEFLYDPGANQNEISTIISSFKEAGVTTLIGLWDPLSPILITREMSNQQWFPEVFVSGTGLSDTTTAGRLYEPTQWSRAFGISPLWVTWENVEASGGYRAAHHGDPSMAPGDEGVLVNIYAVFVGTFFVGVHMAGPILTRDSFAQGMFNYPPTGGIAAGPLVYWTREFPTAVKDFTEVWFDINRPGKDERGEQGLGMMVKANLAKRYRPGEWPATEPDAFVEKGQELTVSDNPPGGGFYEHEQDGHKHQGACKACPGFQTTK